jgi:hypothetical protein
MQRGGESYQRSPSVLYVNFSCPLILFRLTIHLLFSSADGASSSKETGILQISLPTISFLSPGRSCTLALASTMAPSLLLRRTWTSKAI